MNVTIATMKLVSLEKKSKCGWCTFMADVVFQLLPWLLEIYPHPTIIKKSSNLFSKRHKRNLSMRTEIQRLQRTIFRFTFYVAQCTITDFQNIMLTDISSFIWHMSQKYLLFIYCVLCVTINLAYAQVSLFAKALPIFKVCQRMKIKQF